MPYFPGKLSDFFRYLKHFTGEIHFFCKSTIERKCIWNFKVSTLNYHYLASALRFEAFFHNKNKVPNRALWLLRW